MSSKQERTEHWAGLVADQQSSGLCMAAWCRNQSIPFSTFDYWRRQVLSVPSAKSTSSPQKHATAPEWLSVSVAEDSSIPPASGHSTSDVLSLRVGKVTLDVAPGFNSAFLADVLCVLEARC